MKACDLYIQPSRYEGNCVSVHEAQVLGKTVIITNYPTAQSQLHNNEDGVIVPLDNVDCAKGIIDIIKIRLRWNVLVKNVEIVISQIVKK